MAPVTPTQDDVREFVPSPRFKETPFDELPSGLQQRVLDGVAARPGAKGAAVVTDGAGTVPQTPQEAT